jgi:hypothetical protein
MALTQARLGSDDVWGSHRVTPWTLTGDSSYVTGGYTPLSFGIRLILGLFQLSTNTVGYSVMYNSVTGKIQFYLNGTEVANAANISAVSVNAFIVSVDD